MDLDLQGNIERFTLPEILQLIASGRKSGTLGIQKADSIVMVYFREGNIIYGYGPRETYHLGQLLKERGLITAEQLEEAVRMQAVTDNSRRLGEILITRGFIDRADLQDVVRRQVESLLYSLLSWTSGSFKFYEDQFPTEEEITVDLSVENVILEGLRRIDEMNLIRETLPNLEAVYTISAAQGGRARNVALHADEWNIMALVDGHRTLNKVCRLSPLGRDETLRKLAQLKLAGLITKTDRPIEPPAPAADLEKMVGRLAGLLESYMTEKAAPRPAERRITQSLLEQVD
ncbi:MAG TPA: DUF4388 domain-containing protein [candidate division Zixibacteria bacterium]|nr:DUF4388 domain-containing protein [candidate division Zixibacteria bacterium]